MIEICAFVYVIYTYRALWDGQAPAVVVFAIGMLIPTLLVLDRLKADPNPGYAQLPRSFLICGFMAGAIGLFIAPNMGAHAAGAVFLWLLAPQAVLHTLAFRRLRSVRD
jgi:hypothetical protein